MDNNTADPAVWGPVEEYCRDRPARSGSSTLLPWPGYKAGACNLALRQYTDPRAEIIGLIDADDIVQPHYPPRDGRLLLRPRLGFVQTFEGNRDYEGSAYYTACVDSYQGFYLAVMSSRNERDTVPFVGTMGLFRRSALGRSGWLERMVHQRGHRGLAAGAQGGLVGAVHAPLLRPGIVPPTFAGLNTQRHRWCFGGMQILRLHWRSLMPWDRSPDNHLTAQPAPGLPDGVPGLVPGPPHARLRPPAAGDHRIAALGLVLRLHARSAETDRCCPCRSSSSPPSA